MEKSVFKVKLVSAILGIVELCVLVIFSVLYILNIWNIQHYVKTEYILYAACGFIFLSAIISYICISVIYKKRRNSDLTSAQIFGGDIKEAYLFGMLGFVVVDENGTILWTSSLLEQRQIKIIDLNIFEWCPKLKDLIDKDIGNVVTIEQNSVYYQVKYLRSAGLFVFKDVTEYENVDRYCKEQAICLGIIMIDNYSDVSASLNDYSDLIANVKINIIDYAKEHNVLIRAFSNDAYFVVCNYKSLMEMKEDKFSILDKVKNLVTNGSSQPSLSIGMSHGFPDVTKLNSLASNALDIAMSRGGDQAVIAKYGSEMEFFGGRSEAMEKRNKVKIRAIADSIVSLINNASNVIIMGHTDLDMDALGSCLGIKALCDTCSTNKSSFIVYDPKLSEKKTRGAITTSFSKEQLSKIMITPKDAVEKVKPSTLVIVCDVSRPSMTIAPKVLELAEKIIVIDHHRRAEDFIDNPVFSHVDSSASSASELVAELIRFSSNNHLFSMPSTYATIMLSGIFLDTGFFKSKNVGIRTFEASMILKNYGANNGLAFDFLKEEYEEYLLVNKIVSTMKTAFYGVVYCVAEENDIIERSILAKVANQCMQLKGVDACFVIGRTAQNECRISARSNGTVNVQILCEKMNGGGHFTMAACLFKDMNVTEVEEKLKDTLTSYLGNARIEESKKGE